MKNQVDIQDLMKYRNLRHDILYLIFSILTFTEGSFLQMKPEFRKKYVLQLSVSLGVASELLLCPNLGFHIDGYGQERAFWREQFR